jgi:SAM-dependent methyltransferase
MMEFTGIKKDLREYWNTQGIIYDFGYESKEECAFWRGELREIIGESPQKILDIGTGTGFLAMNLTALGYEVTGLDFSEGMMNQARAKMEKTNLSWQLVMGDAEHPDFPDNTFDVIICRYLLWTLPHPEKAVTHWVHMVKPGGKIIVIDGKRKRNDETIKSRVNTFLWKVSRRIFRGYSGIQGHNLEIEKNLPYYEGIGAGEVISYFKKVDLTGSRVHNLYGLPGIIKRNLPWFVRFGYRSSGVVQVIWGEKKGGQE